MTSAVLWQHQPHFIGIIFLSSASATLTVKTLSDTLTISSVSRDVIVQAWQLRDFLASEHQSDNLIDQTSRLVIDRLIKNSFRSARTSTSASFSIIARQQRARSRFVSLDSFVELYQIWSKDWVVDKVSLRTAIRIFHEITIHLRRLYEDPPFIENTPHISSTTISSDQTSIEIDLIIKVTSEEKTRTFEIKKKTPSAMIVNFSEAQRNEMTVIIT